MKLNRDHVQMLRVSKDNITLISQMVYLGYGLFEIRDVLSDPRLESERRQIPRVAQTLGFDKSKHMVDFDDV